MISTGLLWFDDDARRPLTRKIADAVERYRERVGYEPTLCLVNPAQIEALSAPAAGRGRRAGGESIAPVALPATLRIQPSEAISPNCVMVGVATGETPRPVPGRVTPEEDYAGTATRRPRADARSTRAGRNGRQQGHPAREEPTATTAPQPRRAPHRNEAATSADTVAGRARADKPTPASQRRKSA